MKHSTLYIALFLALGCMASCDVIDEDNRYIQEEIPEPPTTATKRVLIEEFTGRMCPNCPNGAQIITEIQNYYEGRVIAIAVHAGTYARPVGAFKDQDFRTEAGNEYNSYYKPQGYPAAMINRNIHDDGMMASTIREKWMTSVIKELEGEPIIEIIPSCSYDAASRTVTVTTEVEALKSMPSGLNLQVQLTESGIVAAQTNGDEIIYDYVHNHVLRQAVNGTWGESLTALPEGEKKSYTHTIVLDEKWVPEQCHIVAYAYETAGNKNVIQCNECAVIETEE